MADNGASGTDLPKRCCESCEKLTKKCESLREARNASRGSVALLQGTAEKLIAEKTRLEKDLEDGRNGQLKSQRAMQELEDEVHKLKDELKCCKENGGSKHAEELKKLMSEHKFEISRLKELLSNETNRADIEKKKADAEKLKTKQAENTLKMAQNKILEVRRNADNLQNDVEAQKKIAEAERRKAEECRLCLEKFQREASCKENLIADFRRKLQEETQKVNVEKKHVEHERRRAEHQKKIAEEERQKAKEKEIYANHLSEQLEEEKLRIGELQLKLDEIAFTQRESSIHSCTVSRDSKSGATDIKHLKMQLKLEKVRVKYAKSTAVIEKSNATLLGQQVHYLKQELSRLSSHMNSIYEHLSHTGIGARESGKIEECVEIPRFDQKNKFLCTKPCKPHLGGDFVQLDKCNDFFSDSFFPREDVGLQSWRRSCSQPTSGISSDLESPVGGFQKKSQSSAACSTYTCFSDKKLMGSQGRDALSNSRMTILPEKLNTCMELPKAFDEVGNVIEPDNIRFASDDGNGICTKRDFSPDCVLELADIASSHSSKRRRIDSKRSSHECVHSSNVPRHGVACALADPYDVLDREYKANCLRSHEGEGVMNVGRSSDLKAHHDCISRQSELSENSKHHSSFGPVHGAKNVVNLHLSGKDDDNYTRETVETVGKSRADSDNVKATLFGNYMRLLDLDNDGEELSFREAFESPLSPTLPEIFLSTEQEHQCDDSLYLVEELSMMNDVPSHTFDVFKLEIDSNVSIIQKTEGKVLSRDLLELPSPSFDETRANGISTVLLAGDSTKFCTVPVPDSLTRAQDKKTCNSEVAHDLEKVACDNIDIQKETAENLLASQFNSTKIKIGVESKEVDTGIDQSVFHEVITNGEHQKRESGVSTSNAHGTCAICLITFSNIEDEERLLRVVNAIERFEVDDVGVHAFDSVIIQVLRAVAFQQELEPEDKVSVLFSWIISNLSLRLTANYEDVVSRDILAFANAFSAQIISALDEENGRSFLEAVQLDIILGLIQDFLLSREVLLCNKSYRPCHSSRKLNCLEGKRLTYAAATRDQLLAGSISLAALCTAFNKPSFALETTYKILRQHSDDKTWVLSMLHVFASVPGGNLFHSDNSGFLTTSIRLVASRLEKLHECDASITFMPCKQCPFLTNEASVEKFVSTLLDVLHQLSSIPMGQPNAIEFSSPSIGVLDSCSGTNGAEAINNIEPLFQNAECDVSCILFKYGMHGKDEKKFNSDLCFCNFTDIVSLVELLACYMSWEWTYNNVIPRLVRTLDSCVSEFFLASLFVLIGELGRFGVEGSGYEHAGIEELRCSLATSLGKSAAGNSCISIQFAACSALLNLLPSNFAGVVGASPDVSSDAAGRSCHIDAASKWFWQLDESQRSAFSTLSCGTTPKARTKASWDM